MMLNKINLFSIWLLILGILVISIILVIPKSVNVTGICNMAFRKCCTVREFKSNCATVQHFWVTMFQILVTFTLCRIIKIIKVMKILKLLYSLRL